MALVTDQAWTRAKHAGVGDRTEAWMPISTADGTPGQREGVVNILRVWVAGQIGHPSVGNVADVDGDGIVNVQDLVVIG